MTLKKKGRGMATIMFGYGYGEGFPDFSYATIEFTDDEKVLVVTAAADVGQGVLTGCHSNCRRSTIC